VSSPVSAVVWVLLAISPDKTFIDGLAHEYVAVFASAEACDACASRCLARQTLRGCANAKRCNADAATRAGALSWIPSTRPSSF
jgi:hypothetical protein